MRTVQMYVCEVCQETDENEQHMLQHETRCFKDKKRAEEERARRIAAGQLTIQQIIEKCKMLETHGSLPVHIVNETEKLYHGWSVSGTDSYRGYYAELSIDPAVPEVPGTRALNRFDLARFTQEMKGAVDRTYGGWKGGEFTMHEDTFVWVSQTGFSGGLMVKDLRLSDDGSEIWLVCGKNSMCDEF